METKKNLIVKEILNNLLIVVLLTVVTSSYVFLILALVYTLIKTPSYIKYIFESKDVNIEELKQLKVKLDDEICQLTDKKSSIGKRLIRLKYQIYEIDEEMDLINDIKNYLLKKDISASKDEEIKLTRVKK